MRMFGNKKSEGDKNQEMYQKFGLDIDKYSESEIKNENTKNLKQIAQDLTGKSWLKAGMAFSMAPAAQQATVGYLSAVFNTNLILIRQNELIIRKLEKLTDK